jgi:serine/threonine protein kinase
MGDSTEDASHSSVPLGPRVESVLNILRIIGKSQLIEAGALEQGSCWDDNMVPYTRTQLPKNKNGNVNYEARFLEEQRKLYDRASFPRSIIRDIIEHAQKNSRPPHIATLHISDIFEIGKLLGEGAYGHVHSVTLPDNDNRLRTKGSNIFALKRIRKPAPTEGGAVRATTPRAFQKELDILSRCTGDNVHRHFIKFCASFTDEDYFGFIVTPVATSSLQQVLSNYINTNNIGDDKDVRAILHSAFGCLLDAVCYLHEDLNIRHRDLKPKNILIHKGRVVICDMGSAYDYEPADRKESTEDRRPPGTYRYKAPEVLRSARSDKPGKHNNKTDIFSLGCIFLEMHTVLNEETLQTMAKAITNDDNTEFDERLDGKDWAYADEHEGVIKWLKGLDSQEESPTRLVKDMVRVQ